jgi:hypothetical protein
MKSSWSARVSLPLIVGLFLVVLPSWERVQPAFAADSAQSPEPPAATAPDGPSEHPDVAPNCRAEVKKLCGGVDPVGGASSSASRTMRVSCPPRVRRKWGRAWNKKV